MVAEKTNNLCIQCKGAIPQGASLCSKCGSYQDGRRYLTFSNGVLTSLTALVSVSALALPVLLKALHTPASAATLSMPTFDGDGFRIVATNVGDAPATLSQALIDVSRLPGATKLRLRSQSMAFIPPGSQLITFDIVPQMSADQAYRLSLDILMSSSAKSGPSDLSAGVIHVWVTQSDGTTKLVDVPVNGNDLFGVLRAHADRCMTEKTPTLENGCLSAGESADEEPKVTGPGRRR